MGASKPTAGGIEVPLPRDGVAVEVVDLGDRLRVIVDIPVSEGEQPSRRRALARAWEALAAAISQTKAALPPMPVAARPARKRSPKASPARTGSGSWWQF